MSEPHLPTTDGEHIEDIEAAFQNITDRLHNAAKVHPEATIFTEALLVLRVLRRLKSKWRTKARNLGKRMVEREKKIIELGGKSAFRNLITEENKDAPNASSTPHGADPE